ncbi:hypothetical protein EXIGLDRAFT_105968 [Exidia glandulosa HHB12029]|uniref:Uncharacterized protein n=1 Tax=Exidia glandulosa HHB12029 TaxID=1314781 RepID=A0A165GUG6_EXIGL|nr:hypothetical protein EXIGLDRAFT_105968 [Exidia glandulosa HHB12029]
MPVSGLTLCSLPLRLPFRQQLGAHTHYCQCRRRLSSVRTYARDELGTERRSVCRYRDMGVFVSPVSLAILFACALALAIAGAIWYKKRALSGEKPESSSTDVDLEARVKSVEGHLRREGRGSMDSDTTVIGAPARRPAHVESRR